jgi:ketosteroid isomerase-like protein
MKHLPLVLVLAIAAASFAQAQTPDKKSGPPAASKSADAGVEQALMKMEQDSLAAILKRDVAAFGRFFADDAVLTTPDGSLQTKAQLLADIKSGDLVLESSSISDMKVRVYGAAAIVTYITTDKGKYKGQDISGRFRWTDTFVRGSGGWQIVAGHGTPVQGPAK